MELIFLVLYYLTVILCVITLVEVKLTNWNAFQFQDGKAEFEKMQSISELPNYGHCWTKTLISFSKGCKYLSADVQGKLALAYLNCFLSMQELPIYPCNVTQKFSKCTKNMKDADRISMATFFTHAQNICYFLEAHNWHNKTAETIIILQTEIKDLSKIISTYSNNIHKSINESRNKIDAHNHLLSKIDSNMSAELTSYSNRFYICMLVLAFLMTLTKHTRAAWPWIVVMSTVNLWIESDIKYCPLSLTGDLFLIACRIILVVLSCLALKASACLYQNDRDYLSVILEKAEKLITCELGKAENKMASDTHIASVDRPNTVHDAPGKSIAEPNVEPSTPITDETQKVNDKGNAVVATRLPEGQGFLECSCKTRCSNNRCRCKKNERKCSDRCHSSTTCDNK